MLPYARRTSKTSEVDFRSVNAGLPGARARCSPGSARKRTLRTDVVLCLAPAPGSELCRRVSRSSRKTPSKWLRGLAGLVDAVVDGVDADRLSLPGKSDPALFLEAARQLGVPPAKRQLSRTGWRALRPVGAAASASWSESPARATAVPCVTGAPIWWLATWASCPSSCSSTTSAASRRIRRSGHAGAHGPGRARETATGTSQRRPRSP